MKQFYYDIRIAKPWSSVLSAAESPESMTFAELFDLYISLYAKTRTKRPGDTEASYNRYFEQFKERPAAEISRMEVQKWVNDLADQSGKHTANRNYDILRAVFNWGIKRNYQSAQPSSRGRLT